MILGDWLLDARVFTPPASTYAWDQEATGHRDCARDSESGSPRGLCDAEPHANTVPRACDRSPSPLVSATWRLRCPPAVTSNGQNTASRRCSHEQNSASPHGSCAASDASSGRESGTEQDGGFGAGASPCTTFDSTGAADADPKSEVSQAGMGFLRQRFANGLRRSSRTSVGNSQWPSATFDIASTNDAVTDAGVAEHETIPFLGSDEDGRLVIQGRLKHIKGWWRKGPRLAERVAEIRARVPLPTGNIGRETGWSSSSSSKGATYGCESYDMLRCQLSKDGSPDRSILKRQRLAGTVAEAIDLPEHPRLYCFRIYVSPEVRDEALDFGVTTEAERDRWLAALAKATGHGIDAATPVCGHLQLTIVQGCLSSEQGLGGPRAPRMSAATPEMFTLARYSGMEGRTAPRRPERARSSRCTIKHVPSNRLLHVAKTGSIVFARESADTPLEDESFWTTVPLGNNIFIIKNACNNKMLQVSQNTDDFSVFASHIDTPQSHRDEFLWTAIPIGCNTCVIKSSYNNRLLQVDPHRDAQLIAYHTDAPTIRCDEFVWTSILFTKGESVVTYGQTLEFPVVDDDPDSLITFETWAPTGRRGQQPRGRISVPLFAFGRNQPRELRLPLRDITIPGRAAEESEIGNIVVRGVFQQPLESLVLPRPNRQSLKTWQRVGEKPIREQWKELEAFLQDFEMFSSRFMHHCETWKSLSIILRRLVQWDQPLLTLLCLLVTTVVVLFLHHHTLPLAVLVILCLTAWHHPWCVRFRRCCKARWPRYIHRCYDRCGGCRRSGRVCSCCRCRRPRASLARGVACSNGRGGAKSKLRSSSGIHKEEFDLQRHLGACSETDQRDGGGSHAPAVEDLPQTLSPDVSTPQIQERFQNERRLMLGKFCSERLRFYDPPSWCDKTGNRAEAPRATEDGVHYIWRIEVTQFTDNDGWRYAKNFNRSAIWRGSFLPNQSFVRTRRHIGRPVISNTVNGQSRASVASPRVGPNGLLSSSGMPAASVQSVGLGGVGGTGSAGCAPSLSSDGCILPVTQAVWDATLQHRQQRWMPRRTSGAFCTTAAFRSAWPAAATSAATVAAPQGPSPGLGGPQQGPKGPEFGIAKTPFHDMYQQMLMRWAYLQRQIEYWMDWYERRKNLFLGVTVHTQTFALIGMAALFAATLILPTRWLVLASIYGFFYDGFSLGQLMRENQGSIISALKDVAKMVWLKNEEDRADKEVLARINSWGSQTSLDEIVDAGVSLLELRDWIREQYYGGQPMIPLRAVQRCGNLGELAFHVIWTSDRFARRRLRKRVWYRSTLRNLLDHVPSDITLFQPLICQGLGDGSTF